MELPPYALWLRNEGLMNSDELENGLRQLDSLAQKEYHVPLADVALSSGDDDEKRLLRLGRLIGVVLRSPLQLRKASLHLLNSVGHTDHGSSNLQRSSKIPVSKIRGNLRHWKRYAPIPT